MSLYTDAPRRRRTRPDDIGTVPVPHEPIAVTAEKWHASLRERDGLGAWFDEKAGR